MALVTKYTCPIAVSRNKAEDDIVIAAMQAAITLAVKYGVDSVRHTDKLGLLYLTAARRRKGGVDLTYRSETAIITDYRDSVNAFNKSVSA